MPNATTKTNPVVYLPVGSVADIGNAAAAALTINYTVHVYAERVTVPGTGGAPDTTKDVWTIVLTGSNNPDGVSATMGDVFVWHPDLLYLEAMTQAKFSSLYTPA